MKKKINSFADLEVWKKSHLLATIIYKATTDFPKSEAFGLTTQMRRCAVSISSNIAEGFSRMSKKEKSHFVVIAKGSLNELKSQVLIARDVGFMQGKVFDKIAEDCIEVSKLLTGFLRSVK